MDHDKQVIRFIDSRYRELFRVQDGDSIEISYPNGDLRLGCRYSTSVSLQKKWKQSGRFINRLCGRKKSWRKWRRHRKQRKDMGDNYIGTKKSGGCCGFKDL